MNRLYLYVCTLCLASRNINDWWLAYWITHDSNQNNTSTENSSEHLAFYLGVYGGLALANSVRHNCSDLETLANPKSLGLVVQISD